jgi:hypothetical protein
MELAGLQAELLAAREAGRQDTARFERQLAAELAAGRDKIALIRQELTTEIETGRKEADLRQAELAAALETGRQETARTVAGLSAELDVSRKEAAQLRDRLAELEAARSQAAPREPQRSPEGTAAAASGRGARLSLVIMIVVLGLAGLAAVIAVQQRRGLARRAATPGPSRDESPGTTAAGTGPGPAGVPQSGPKEDVTPQLVVEALRRGDLRLFEARFAELAGLRAPQVHRILYGTSGEDLAIVCRALGIDKLLFASIFLLSHKDHPAESKVGPRDLSRVTAFYDRITDESARQVLQEWQSDPGLPGVIERLRGAAEIGSVRRKAMTTPANARYIRFVPLARKAKKGKSYESHSDSYHYSGYRPGQLVGTGSNTPGPRDRVLDHGNLPAGGQAVDQVGAQGRRTGADLR